MRKGEFRSTSMTSWRQSRIDEYLMEKTFEEFSKDNKTIDAVVRNFAVIGEATKNVPASVKRKHPEIAWKRMSGMRDKVIHEYFGVDPRILWDTSKLICQHSNNC